KAFRNHKPKNSKASNQSCPENWAYLRQYHKCYELYSKGPCGERMEFIGVNKTAAMNYLNRDPVLQENGWFQPRGMQGQCYNSGVSYRLELDPCPTSKLGAYFSQYYFWKHVCYAKRLHDVAPSIQNDPVYVCAEGFELDPNGGCERPTNL
ncbi:unnamed protein product, partial [Allacma fusca]